MSADPARQAPADPGEPPAPPQARASAAAKVRNLWEEREALARLAEIRARPAPRPMPAMDRALRKALAPILKEAGPSAGTLESRWEEIVGARIAAVTRPVRVAPGKNGATLHIEAASAAAPMIQHAADHIMERVGLATGAKIRTLKIVQTSSRKRPSAPGPAAPPPLSDEQRMALDRSLAPIQTPAVREALEQLGEAVLRWNRR